MKHLHKFESLFDNIPMYSDMLSEINDLLLIDSPIQYVDTVFMEKNKLYVFGGYESIRPNADGTSTERELSFRFALAERGDDIDINLNWSDNYLVFDDYDEEPFENEYNEGDTYKGVSVAMEYIKEQVQSLVTNWKH